MTLFSGSLLRHWCKWSKFWDATFQVDLGTWKKALCCPNIGRNEIVLSSWPLSVQEAQSGLSMHKMCMWATCFHFLADCAKVTLSMEIWVQIHTLGVLGCTYVPSTLIICVTYKCILLCAWHKRKYKVRFQTHKCTKYDIKTGLWGL